MDTEGLAQVELVIKAGDIRDAGSTPGWEGPLEEEMATHSSILAWDNPMDKRSLAGYGPRGRRDSDMTEAT